MSIHYTNPNMHDGNKCENYHDPVTDMEEKVTCLECLDYIIEKVKLPPEIKERLSGRKNKLEAFRKEDLSIIEKLDVSSIKGIMNYELQFFTPNMKLRENQNRFSKFEKSKLVKLDSKGDFQLTEIAIDFIKSVKYAKLRQEQQKMVDAGWILTGEKKGERY